MRTAEQSNYLKELLLFRVFIHGGSLTGALKDIGNDIGISYVTLYNHIKGRFECTESTASKILNAGWKDRSGNDAKEFYNSLASASASDSQPKENSQPNQTSDNNGAEFSRGFEAGRKYERKSKSDDLKNEFQKGRVVGYSEGFEAGKLQSRFSYSSVKNDSIGNSPDIQKLKSVINLHKGNESRGEAVAANNVASLLLSKILKEKMGLDLSISINSIN